METIDTASIQLDKEPSIMVGKPDATMQPTPQDNQLMPENRILRLKPTSRLEWRGQRGQNKPNQRDHRAKLAESVIG
jgi:hypothetical protein